MKFDCSLFFICAVSIVNYTVYTELTLSKILLAGQCAEYPDVAIKINFTNVKVTNGVIFLNNTITVNKDLFSPNVTMTVDLKRCVVRENPATCEEFHSFKLSRLCKVINKTQKFRFIQPTVPPISCPSKKGTYSQRDINYDLSTILLFPTSTYFWKFNIIVQEDDTDEVILCTRAEALLVNKIGRRRGRTN